MADIEVREFTKADVPAMCAIWNEVVDGGISFPQEEPLDEQEALRFFSQQSRTAVVVLEGAVVGLYILHPNNVGRCGHIANASYAVDASCRGHHIGEKLVVDSLAQARELGFRILQFNAVVASNIHAIHLYERLGFQRIGMVRDGFHMKNGSYADIILFYRKL